MRRRLPAVFSVHVAVVGGRGFASLEKHAAYVKAGARGPLTITAVFLTASGSHLTRKRPQRRQKPISEIRFLPRLRLFIRGFFRR